jgi:hypothetical protein
MSVRISSDGRRVLALRRRLPPVLYNLHSREPLCQFDHPGYYNSCTMKSCCFAGEKDEVCLFVLNAAIFGYFENLDVAIYCYWYVFTTCC